LVELEMLPEWAGRKAAVTPSLPVQPDETAPIPAVGPVEAIADPGTEVDEVPLAGLEVDADGNQEVLHHDEAAAGNFTHPEEVASRQPEPRSGRLLLVLALVALAAGVLAGYLYLMLAS
jgi:hypothetical protein